MGDGVNIAARLEGIAAPGGVCLSEDAYRQVREKLNHEIIDLGQKVLKNIARPIGAYALKLGLEGAAPTPSGPEAQGPPPLSIVVLPFANMGSDPEQDYFVDGVTESLTTDLSRIGGFFVIGRNTAFTYKGKPVDLKQIGRELNVRYVLEGSVQRVGIRMRVSVQLIDAGSGHHIWAERFDKPLVDLFDMQDEIVARLARALDSQLFAAEARRAERATNPGSMDLCFQGWSWWNKGFTPDCLAKARSLFEQALALDPDNLWALVGVAIVDTVVATTFLSDDDRATRLAAAEAAVTKALSLAPESAIAHLCLGIVQIRTNQVAEGVRHCERALQLDRNLAGARAEIGYAKLHLGQAEDTEAHIQEALRLSPHDKLSYIWCMTAGMAKLYLRREEEAVNWLQRSIEINRSFPSSHFLLAAALAHLARLPEARSVLRAGLAINPTLTISRVRANAPSDNPIAVAGREHFISGLRKAGMGRNKRGAAASSEQMLQIHPVAVR
jgi:TolB-like protein